MAREPERKELLAIWNLEKLMRIKHVATLLSLAVSAMFFVTLIGAVCTYDLDTTMVAGAASGFFFWLSYLIAR